MITSNTTRPTRIDTRAAREAHETVHEIINEAAFEQLHRQPWRVIDKAILDLAYPSGYDAADSRWLPAGLSFLSGLPIDVRRRRRVMAVQTFVDDSGGAGHSRHFVLAGLMADAENWAEFSTEWRACLDESPAIRIFKMKDAAGLSGQFWHWTEEQRDEKLRSLARIINRHAGLALWMVIDLEAHAKYRLQLGKPHREPYFFPFQTMIIGACFELWDLGCRERFEIIFDEQKISGLRAKKWYPVLREIMKKKEPGPHSLLPVEPIFKTDDEFLPLQACDMLAWCLRRNTDNPDDQVFTWLLKEMPNLRQSEYCGYFDEERFEGIAKLTDAAIKGGDLWQELFRTAAEIRRNR